MMASIDGRPVVASGILQFHGTEIARTDTNPSLTFQIGETGSSDAINGHAFADGFRFVTSVPPGSTSTSIIRGLTADGEYKVYCAISRVVELPGGPFYEARYTLVKY